MTTVAFNLWAARFQLRRMDERMVEIRAAAAAAILNDQRTACATTCRIELFDATTHLKGSTV